MEKFIMLLGAINKMDYNRMSDLKDILGWITGYTIVIGIFVCAMTAIVLVLH